MVSIVPSRLSSQLELIVGPMFSGKTTELLRRLRKHQYAGKKTLLVKPTRDTRTKMNVVETHNHELAPAYAHDTIASCCAQNVLAEVDVLCIDEGQFFPDILMVREIIATYPALRVIIAALSGDYNRELFGDLWKLMPLASDIEQCHAVCFRCKCDGAAYTYRTVETTEQTLIGAAESYQAACGMCFALLKQVAAAASRKHHASTQPPRDVDASDA